MDNLNDDGNIIKSDSNGNEISLVSGISIHHNQEVFWFPNVSYFYKYIAKNKKLKTLLDKLFLKIISYFVKKKIVNSIYIM